MDLWKIGGSSIETKMCSTCKEVKSVSEFDKDHRYRSGYRSQCVQCRYSVFASTKRHAIHVERTYGLSQEDYKRIMEEQNGVCAICHKPETRITRPKARRYISKQSPNLALDHDHTTKAIRGFLCSKCNLALGHFQDSIELLENAIKYLKKWEK
ncbi:MAG: hypothetical protein EB101_12750 [Chitinophagia bacterium]|nr:hypothetical protein [Chitinophagia bacterium]